MFFKASQPQKPNTDQKMVLEHRDFASLFLHCSPSLLAFRPEPASRPGELSICKWSGGSSVHRPGFCQEQHLTSCGGLRNCSVTNKVFSQQKANPAEVLREKVSKYKEL